MQPWSAAGAAFFTTIGLDFPGLLRFDATVPSAQSGKPEPSLVL